MIIRYCADHPEYCGYPYILGVSRHPGMLRFERRSCPECAQRRQAELEASHALGRPLRSRPARWPSAVAAGLLVLGGIALAATQLNRAGEPVTNTIATQQLGSQRGEVVDPSAAVAERSAATGFGSAPATPSFEQTRAPKVASARAKRKGAMDDCHTPRAPRGTARRRFAAR